jgi:hypothetical protein
MHGEEFVNSSVQPSVSFVGSVVNPDPEWPL